MLDDQVFIQQNVDLDSAVTIEQIASPEGRITDQHRRILQVAKAKGTRLPREIIKPQLFTELQIWNHPLHFLDFEAGSFAVPVRSGRNPYDMVVFQFSCHSLYADGSLEHHQWLHPGDATYPNFELVKELKKVPNLSRGTIVHYSGFERSALKRLRSEIKDNPKDLANAGELVQWLDGIIEHPKVKSGPSPMMADLSRIVKFYYYNREMADSLSIKDVVESIMKISPKLKEQYSRPYNSSNFSDFIWWQQKNGQLISPYQLLQEHPEGSIREGAEAMVAYAQLRAGNLGPDQAELTRQGLLRYCELDTLAMVMIYRHWKAVMEENPQNDR
ncbi:MAG: DUF2779 domain-containing protein [Balneolaceae bacterium]|nr:DUF2779 domain-containing protein [Balneolaceae bacterium]